MCIRDSRGPQRYQQSKKIIENLMFAVKIEKKITLLSSPQGEEVCLFVGVIALIYNLHKAYKLYYRIH